MRWPRLVAMSLPQKCSNRQLLPALPRRHCTSSSPSACWRQETCMQPVRLRSEPLSLLLRWVGVGLASVVHCLRVNQYDTGVS